MTYRVLTALISFLLGAGLALWLTTDNPVGARKLETPKREVLIRELDKGYVVQYRTTNNPYPSREVAVLDPVEAAIEAKNFLKQPVPRPQWGF